MMNRSLAIYPRVRYFILFFAAFHLIAFNFLNKTFTQVLGFVCVCVCDKKNSIAQQMDKRLTGKALNHKVDSITVNHRFQPTNKNNVLFIFGIKVLCFSLSG